MPTTRSGRVRHLLNRKQARVVGMNPFTIQLLYEVGNYTQDIILGIDPGRTNIGITAVKEIIAEDSSAQIIIVSSVGTQQQLKAAIEAGAKDFVQKPINAEQIKAIVSAKFD